MNQVEIEQGEITLKQFLKNKPECIQITPELNQYSAWHSEHVKIKGQNQDVSMHYHTTIETDIQSEDLHYNNDNVPQKIALSGGNSETLLTLLAHKPDKIRIEYWVKNDSIWMEKRGLHQETIIFRGLKHNKKGEVTKTHSVSINYMYDDHTPHYMLNAIR